MPTEILDTDKLNNHYNNPADRPDDYERLATIASNFQETSDLESGPTVEYQNDKNARFWISTALGKDIFDSEEEETVQNPVFYHVAHTLKGELLGVKFSAFELAVMAKPSMGINQGETYLQTVDDFIYSFYRNQGIAGSLERTAQFVLQTYATENQLKILERVTDTNQEAFPSGEERKRWLNLYSSPNFGYSNGRRLTLPSSPVEVPTQQQALRIHRSPRYAQPVIVQKRFKRTPLETVSALISRLGK